MSRGCVVRENVRIMKRTTAAVAFVLLAACSSSRPAAEPEPYREPVATDAVDQAVVERMAAVEEGAAKGRAVGSVVGVLAAVLGGGRSESLDDAIDRYLLARDAGEAIGAMIGATKGASAGAQRRNELDVQFAELQQIEGVAVTRPFPGELQVRLASAPAPETLAAVAAVFEGRGERAIELEGAADAVLTIREALIELGLPSESLSARRNEAVDGVLLRVRER